MLEVVVRRIAGAIPLLLVVSALAFSLSVLVPGDPAVAMAGEFASEEQIELLRQSMNLDESAPVRYVTWLGDVVQGDLGTSAGTRRSISAELGRRIPITATIAGGAFLLAVLVGVPIGLLQGMNAGRWIDRSLLVGVSLGLSTPNFWLATLLVASLAVNLQWLPSVGYVPFAESPVEWARHLVLPIVTLAVFAAAEVTRQLRTGLVEIAEHDFIRAAWAKGLPRIRVIGKHALKNASMPALTIVGLRLGHLFAGSVIIEEIFGIPGLGSYALQAIQNRDFPVIQAVILVSAAIIVVINLLVDIAYAALNPKVRVG